MPLEKVPSFSPVVGSSRPEMGVRPVNRTDRLSRPSFGGIMGFSAPEDLNPNRPETGSLQSDSASLRWGTSGDWDNRLSQGRASDDPRRDPELGAIARGP